MPELECTILSTEQDIEAVADEWRQLNARAGRSPFTDFDMFWAWWQTLGKNPSSRLCIVIGRKAGMLAGVLPLMIVHRRGLRMMLAVGHKVFNYSDILCENPEQALELWQAAHRLAVYDFADIRDVYEESFSHKALSAFARKRDDIGALSLRFKWPTSKEWIASLPGQIRKPFMRRQRRLEEKGPIKFEVCRNEPLPEKIVDDMIRLKTSWAAENQKRGVYDYRNAADYFHRLVKLAARQDFLLLGWLKCGDDIIAYTLCLPYQGVMHGCVIAYNPAWANYGPGILTMKETICWAIDNGFKAYDHRHGTNDYKSRFSNDVRDCSEFTFSSSWRARLIETVFFTLRTVSRKIKRNSLESVDETIKSRLEKTED